MGIRILNILEFLIILIIITISFNCEPDVPYNEYYYRAKRYFYSPIYPYEKRDLYIVDTILRVGFKENVTLDQVKKLNKQYNINYKSEWFTNSIQCEYSINWKTIYAYLTKYGTNNECFGNDSIIEFTSLGYELYPGEFTIEGGYYITDRFYLMYDKNEYNEELLNNISRINIINKVQYFRNDTNGMDIQITLKVTKDSPCDALDMANLYREKYSITRSTPDFTGFTIFH
jgi:hypothetical protein